MHELSILLISPVRNEAAHIARVVRSVAGQTYPPKVWVLLDDNSTDGTRAMLDSLANQVPFMHVVSAPRFDDLHGARDRLAAAAAPRVFNAGLKLMDGTEFDFVGKLDGDAELPPRYFEELMQRFADDPALGIAGGDMVERVRDGWRRIAIPSHHVPGALKLYRWECFANIGGVQESLGWDTIDETLARSQGYRTRSYRDLVVTHHRPWGSADGKLRGRARHGVAAWTLGYGPGWALLRAVKLATVRPFGVSGAAFYYGYLKAALRRAKRADPEFRRYLRSELRGRLRSVLRLHPITPVSTTSAGALESEPGSG